MCPTKRPRGSGTGRILGDLAALQPRSLAIMHGSSFHGDGAQALKDLATVMKEVLGPRAEQGATATGMVGDS